MPRNKGEVENEERALLGAIPISGSAYSLTLSPPPSIM